MLQLESFARPALQPLPEPGFSAEDLEAARAAGEALGRAAAVSAAQSALTTAVADLAAALADDAARRAEIEAGWQARLAALAGAVVAALAPALRAESLAEAVVAALRAELATAADAPPAIACEAAAQPVLRAALDAAGLGAVAIATAARGAEIAARGGLVSIDPDRVRAGLEAIIAEMKETAA